MELQAKINEELEEFDKKIHLKEIEFAKIQPQQKMATPEQLSERNKKKQVRMEEIDQLHKDSARRKAILLELRGKKSEQLQQVNSQISAGRKKKT